MRHHGFGALRLNLSVDLCLRATLDRLSSCWLSLLFRLLLLADLHRVFFDAQNARLDFHGAHHFGALPINLTLKCLHEQIITGDLQVELFGWRLLLSLQQARHLEPDLLVRLDHVLEALSIIHDARALVFDSILLGGFLPLLFRRRGVFNAATQRAIIVALLGLVSRQAIQIRVHDDLLLHGSGLDRAHEHVIDRSVLVHSQARHIGVPVFGALGARLLRSLAVLVVNYGLGPASVLL